MNRDSPFLIQKPTLCTIEKSELLNIFLTLAFHRNSNFLTNFYIVLLLNSFLAIQKQVS